MSIVAWDGKTLAADRMALFGDTQMPFSKIRRLEDCVVAWVGRLEHGAVLLEWIAGRHEWPAFQNEDHFTTLIVAKTNLCHFYEQSPIPITVENPFMAWGIGREVAIGAMAMGADARKAVELASIYCSGCGFGVDAFDL